MVVSYRIYSILLLSGSSAAPNATPAPPLHRILPPPAVDPPASSSSPPSPSSTPPWDSLPDEVWEHAFSSLRADADRGAAAAVCRRWLRAERRSRRRLAVRNCYAVAPRDAVRRFPAVRAALVKGKPHFADFEVLPPDWGAYAAPWVAAAANGWPLLEELSFKRMVVTDNCLRMIAASFGNFQVLRICKCEGFTAAGLAAITHGCRNLRELYLERSNIDNNPSSHWLSNFPESFTSLETLNFSCLKWEVNLTVLERLVSRCRNLKTLKLNNDIPLDNVASLLCKAPKIIELGIGKFSDDYQPDLFAKVESAFEGCKSLRRLSGGWGAVPDYLPAFYCVCEGLTSLNLYYVFVQCPVLIEFISRCKNLLQLRVNNMIGDHGISVVASTCSKLQDLRVVTAHFFRYTGGHVFLTETGLVDVCANCPMLESVIYFCDRMTNEALITIAMNRPNLTSFRFGIHRSPDDIAPQPLDAGFRAIVESCKGLRRLSISAPLTDLGLKSVGEHADRVEVLSLGHTGGNVDVLSLGHTGGSAEVGGSDLGLHYILSGCKSLKRLQITKCPFGDMALLANAAKLETLRYLWMSECKLTVVGCRLLGLKMPRLTVEVINDPDEANHPLESFSPYTGVYKLYVYRTLAGPRSDAPGLVQIASSIT